MEFVGEWEGDLAGVGGGRNEGRGRGDIGYGISTISVTVSRQLTPSRRHIFGLFVLADDSAHSSCWLFIVACVTLYCSEPLCKQISR